jgi:hypothetical protein
MASSVPTNILEALESVAGTKEAATTTYTAYQKAAEALAANADPTQVAALGNAFNTAKASHVNAQNAHDLTSSIHGSLVDAWIPIPRLPQQRPGQPQVPPGR